MIAIVFLLILVALIVALSFMGVAVNNNLISEVLLLVGLFAVFFGSGIHVGAALGVLGLIAGFAFSDRPFWAFIGQTIWSPSSSFVLVAVPLFLLMGEILLRAGDQRGRIFRSRKLQRVARGERVDVLFFSRRHVRCGGEHSATERVSGRRLEHRRLEHHRRRVVDAS